jgi:hypothetical protein
VFEGEVRASRGGDRPKIQSSDDPSDVDMPLKVK